MAAWRDETSMNSVLLHAGQSAQPSPEPVRRTAAPVTMIAQMANNDGESDGPELRRRQSHAAKITAVTRRALMGQN